MPDQQPNRFIPAHADAFTHGLPNFTKRLVGGGPVKIVAIGSSSTAGEGSIVPYPARLQSDMQRKYGDRVMVLNRGKSGEEAPRELTRMKADVIDEAPALVIWQVGTNAVWQLGHDLDVVAAAIARGLAQLGGKPIDVVLMDLQYVPAVLTDDKIVATRRMLSLIAEAAATANVNLFDRYAMMQKWHEVEQYGFDTLVDPTDMDRLHLSDWSTQRVAFELSETIAVAAAGTLSGALAETPRL
jgi:lysophospholipase L1-like esterase